MKEPGLGHTVVFVPREAVDGRRAEERDAMTEMLSFQAVLYNSQEFILCQC
jgi:hypothetical protein